MTIREENIHAGGKWETMNFLGVALHLLSSVRDKIMDPVLEIRKKNCWKATP